MASMFYTAEDVLHKIKVWLYPGYLPKTKGLFVARTDHEETLGIEQVCAAKRNRGGFLGNHEDLIINVKKFIDEVIYQLCDGYAVNFGPFTIYPNIRGTFVSENEDYDRLKNPIDFRIRIHSQLRKMADFIQVEILGMASGNAFITDFIDQEEDSVNNIFVPGNMFTITGKRIKIAGSDPSCGVYFVPVENPSQVQKVARIGDNKESRITGIAPDTQNMMNRIEIRTQYANGDVLLKEPRVITSRFVIQAE